MLKHFFDFLIVYISILPTLFKSIFYVICDHFQAQSTGTGFEFSRSGSGKSILSQYEYNRKAKMPRVDVQQTENIEEFEDDDWLDMDFYEDNIKTGRDTWNNNCPFTLSVNSNINTFWDY